MPVDSNLTPLLALTLGVACGVRPLLALALLDWELDSHRIDLSGTPLSLFSRPFTPWALVIGAIFELMVDRRTPPDERSRPGQIGFRGLVAALGGAAYGASSGRMVIGACAGLAGGAIGCLGSIRPRKALAGKFRNDRMAGLVEDMAVILLVFAGFGGF